MVNLISSKDNPMIKEYLKLTNSRSHRRKMGAIAVEGPNLVGEALNAGLKPAVLFIGENFDQSRLQAICAHAQPDCFKTFVLTDQLFAYIADTDTPQQVAAIFPYPAGIASLTRKEIKEPVVILDQLQDPGNMGTIIRTAAAAGVKELYLTPGCTDPYSPKALRATAGAIFRLQAEPVKDLPAFIDIIKARGLELVVAVSGTGRDYRLVDFTKPLALAIGNETSGISKVLLEQADQQVTIDLAGNVESLNAAVAAGILIFEIYRYRNPVALEE